MTPFLQLSFLLVIILFFAKLAGYLSTRLGQPSVLGEILVGLVLGPTLINLTHTAFISDAHLGDVLIELGEIGVMLLMFLAGLELHLTDMAEYSRLSVLAGSFGVGLNVCLGWLIGRIFGMTGAQAFLFGLAIAATSVSVSAQTLLELKALRSRVGHGLLGSAIMDDILVILLLSAFVALLDGNGAIPLILGILVKMILFLGLSVGFGLKILPWITHKVSHLPISQGNLTLALIIVLIYGIAAELLGGMAAITGAFIAGMMFARTAEKDKIDTGIRSLAYSFFVPLFFVNIGLNVDLRQLSSTSLFLVIITCLAAVLGKLVGVGFGARLGRFNWQESLQLGLGMIARGEVSLIVINVGLNNGLISQDGYSAVVATVIFTILVTPPLLRAAFSFQPPLKNRALASDKEIT